MKLSILAHYLSLSYLQVCPIIQVTFCINHKKKGTVATFFFHPINTTILQLHATSNWPPTKVARNHPVCGVVENEQHLTEINKIHYCYQYHFMSNGISNGMVRTAMGFVTLIFEAVQIIFAIIPAGSRATLLGHKLNSPFTPSDSVVHVCG